jgi:hypothetical protein
MVDDDLLDRARDADARHWNEHRRPISADTLRRNLRIGAARSRLLVAIIRTDSQQQSAPGEIAALVGVWSQMIAASELAPVARRAPIQGAAVGV